MSIAPARVDWTAWAANAKAITCEGCQREFQPNHPRRRHCGQPDCEGPRRSDSRRRRPTQAEQRASRRRASIQGVLADVLLEVNRPDAPEGTGRELAAAVRAVATQPTNRRRALVRLCAIAATIAVTVDR